MRGFPDTNGSFDVWGDTIVVNVGYEIENLEDLECCGLYENTNLPPPSRAVHPSRYMHFETQREGSEN